MPKSELESDAYSEAETIARREAALKRAFAMPHKPHEAMKAGRQSKRPVKKGSP